MSIGYDTCGPENSAIFAIYTTEPEEASVRALSPPAQIQAATLMPEIPVTATGAVSFPPNPDVRMHSGVSRPCEKPLLWAS